MQIITTNNNFNSFRAKVLVAPSVSNVSKSKSKNTKVIDNFKILKSINNNPNDINNLPVEKIGEYLKARSNSLPTSISPIFQVTGNFLCGKINVDMYKKVVDNLDKKLQELNLEGKVSDWIDDVEIERSFLRKENKVIDVN